MTDDMEHPVLISRASITLVACFNESLEYVFMQFYTHAPDPKSS